MKKSLTLKDLEADKNKLEQFILQAQKQLVRWDGALGYIMDNIKKFKEVENARKSTGNKG